MILLAEEFCLKNALQINKNWKLRGRDEMKLYNVFDEMLCDETFRFLTDRIKFAPQTGSFLQEKYADLTKWKAEYLPKIKDLVGHEQERVPLNAEITEIVEFDGYTRKKVYFDSARGCRVSAYLLIPHGLTEKAPAVLVMHDHGAMAYWGKEKAVEHKEPIPVLDEFVAEHYEYPLASSLAKDGYVTLAIDGLCFGERSFKVTEKAEFKERLAKYPLDSKEYVQEYNDCVFEMQGDIARIFFLAGTSLMAHRLWDDIVSIDYLSSLPEVDSERIGCIGLSMGGYRSGWLAIMDDRIKCAVMAGAMQRYREMLQHRLPQVEWMWTVPGLYGMMDYEDIISLRAPKPLMLVQGIQDWLFEPEDTGQKAINHVKAVYEKAGASANFKHVSFDGPHVFLPNTQAKAFTWMDFYLKGDSE